MLQSKWQWVDNHFGPMGWFTDEEKAEHEGTPEFSNGKWVPLTPEKVAEMNAWLKQQWHEQS